ncbi:hypothetical protein Mapa_016760 [Marchantia paleacea]|nr:hypothetical protein Mapa_016760 [Marchantia paleacea]
MAVAMVALGSQGFQVSAQGLGCMGMSILYGAPKPDEEMIELIHEAVSRGVTMLDTSDAYGPHANEILVGKVGESKISELGIGIVTYSPLGRGFFSGKNFEDFAEDDYRKNADPRFSSENFQQNKRLYEHLCELGAKMKCTPGQLALAWVQHKGMVPIPGTTKLKNLEENIGSLQIKLSEQEVQALEAAVPPEKVQGERYMHMSSTWQFTNSPPLVSNTRIAQA